MGVGRVCLGVLAVALAGACGLTSPGYEQSHTATQILADASVSTGASRSFHVTVDETTPAGPATADLDVENSNFSGKIAFQGITARIMQVGGQAFIYGSDLAAVLAPINPQAAAAVSAKASDKWVLVPSDLWGSSFSQLFDVQKLSSCLKAAPGVVKKGTSAVSGQQVVEIDDQTGSQIFVQSDAPHRFVRVVLSGVDSCATDSTAAGQTIVLSRYDARFHITAPSGYVDLKTLTGSS